MVLPLVQQGVGEMVRAQLEGEGKEEGVAEGVLGVLPLGAMHKRLVRGGAGGDSGDQGATE